MSEALPEPRVSEENKERTLQEHLLYWQKLLDDLPPDYGTEDSAEFRHAIVHDLDRLWPYHQAICNYRGWGLRITTGDNGLPMQEKDYFENVEVSYGFDVIQLGGDNSRWLISYGFLDRAATDDLPTFKSSTFIVAETAEINPIATDAELFAPVLEEILQPKIYQLLRDRSDQLVVMLNEPDFFGLSVKDQRDIVDQALHEITQEADELGGVHNRLIIAEAELGYMNVRDRDGKLERREIDLASIDISGENIGLCVLGSERLEQQEPVRSPEDWVDCQSGFCLVVVMDGVTQEKVGLPGRILYLPLSGQTLEISFPLRDTARDFTT